MRNGSVNLPSRPDSRRHAAIVAVGRGCAAALALTPSIASGQASIGGEAQPRNSIVLPASFETGGAARMLAQRIGLADTPRVVFARTVRDEFGIVWGLHFYERAKPLPLKGLCSIRVRPAYIKPFRPEGQAQVSEGASWSVPPPKTRYFARAQKGVQCQDPPEQFGFEAESARGAGDAIALLMRLQTTAGSSAPAVRCAPYDCSVPAQAFRSLRPSTISAISQMPCLNGPCLNVTFSAPPAAGRSVTRDDAPGCDWTAQLPLANNGMPVRLSCLPVLHRSPASY
jgi:hypothetical protein